jgi:hypothetical protein
MSEEPFVSNFPVLLIRIIRNKDDRLEQRIHEKLLAVLDELLDDL